MKRMITVGLTAALAVAPATGVAQLTEKKVAKIVKRVLRAELSAIEPGGDTVVSHAATAGHADTAGHAATTGRASTAGHADTSGHASTAGRADTAARADTVGHASTAGHATTAGTAETAEVAGIAESANPMAYAYVRKDGFMDPARASGGITFSGGAGGDYCFSGPRPKGIQVTVEYTGTYSYFGPSLRYPVVVAALGPGDNCPAGTEFYVRGFNATDGQRGLIAFFLSLVL